ncbi:hypothetical protein H6P81_007646 [Aristolochia fimbriata]|uniref:Calmodulin-binding heat-shock protein n=1 Tax=Aristolochia fimbriata TaxID=158543 RepID=A0AAV7F4N8_ARIFI|nr:hypothetical protein H6P81_007646 [Aristolochia fimbriata]
MMLQLRPLGIVLPCWAFPWWVWKRCSYVGSDDSNQWSLATAEEFEPVPHICRLILAVYEFDLGHPKFAPPAGYGIQPDWVVKRVHYDQTQGRAPPYLIYMDHEHQEIVLAMRGLNIASESDYMILLDNRLGMQMFDGGYVHHGLIKAAVWLLNQETDTLLELWRANGCSYKMVFAGHSLGSGVAALMTIIVVNHRDRLGGIPRSLIRCYAVAPARSMSLNLAVRYADVIHSVVLQDDFLPRTSTPLEDHLKAICCLPCLIFFMCLRDTWIPEEKRLMDPRRLYAPGRVYHIVERKFCRCGRFPPEVRTAIPVDGRFEHIVLSCNAASDHEIISITRESTKALEVMMENIPVTEPPSRQRFEKKQTLEKEHKDALERAVSLNVPHAVSSTDRPTDDIHVVIESNGNEVPLSELKPSGITTSWDALIERLFSKDESGSLILNKDIKMED